MNTLLKNVCGQREIGSIADATACIQPVATGR
jgi:hypothetical protein